MKPLTVGVAGVNTRSDLDAEDDARSMSGTVAEMEGIQKWI